MVSGSNFVATIAHFALKVGLCTLGEKAEDDFDQAATLAKFDGIDDRVEECLLKYLPVSYEHAQTPPVVHRPGSVSQDERDIRHLHLRFEWLNNFVDSLGDLCE